MTLSDLVKYTMSDIKCRAVSLRQLSFFFCVLCLE